MDEGDDEILRVIKRNVEMRMTLLREKKFAELRKFLDETYGAKPDQRHGYLLFKVDLIKPLRPVLVPIKMVWV